MRKVWFLCTINILVFNLILYLFIEDCQQPCVYYCLSEYEQVLGTSRRTVDTFINRWTVSVVQWDRIRDSNAEDGVINPRSGQQEQQNPGICCFSQRLAAVYTKIQDSSLNLGCWPRNTQKHEYEQRLGDQKPGYCIQLSGYSGIHVSVVSDTKCSSHY